MKRFRAECRNKRFAMSCSKIWLYNDWADQFGHLIIMENGGKAYVSPLTFQSCWNAYLDWNYGSRCYACAMKYKMSLLQTDPSISADPNSFQICWNTWRYRSHLLASEECLKTQCVLTFNFPGRYSAVIAIFLGIKMSQNCFAMITNSLFRVLPFLSK